MRVAIGREARRNRLSLWMTYQSRVLLEDWSRAHPEEEVMGMGTISQGIYQLKSLPAAIAFSPEARLAFIGWTANGDPMRVAWFRHATYPRRRKHAFAGAEDKVPAETAQNLRADDGAFISDESTLADQFASRIPVELKPAWRLSDPAIERDAEIFWRREKLLRKAADVASRLGEICLAAYDGDELIGLSTSQIKFFDFLGVKLATLRLATARSARRNHLSLWMGYQTRLVLEAWSLAHPEEEVMGMGVVSQAAYEQTTALRAPAIRRGSGSHFIGWTANGDPMYVAWFAHGTFPRRLKRAYSGADDEE